MEAPQPFPRSNHAAVCLGHNTNDPQLLVIGGCDFSSNILRDIWCLSVQAQSWQQVRLYHYYVILNNNIVVSLYY